MKIHKAHTKDADAKPDRLFDGHFLAEGEYRADAYEHDPDTVEQREHNDGRHLPARPVITRLMMQRDKALPAANGNTFFIPPPSLLFPKDKAPSNMHGTKKE